MKLELVDAKVAAKELRVSQQLLRNLVKEGRVPFYRLSERTLRFDLGELRDHMKHNAEKEHVRPSR
jgi:excisionase family DNA binding protein